MGIIENLQQKLDKLEGQITHLTTQVDKFLNIVPAQSDPDDLVSIATLSAETSKG